RRVPAVAVAPDGKALAGAADKAICFWDAATGQVVRQLDGHDGKIKSLDFSPDGKFLASAGSSDADGKPVRVWDVAAGRERLPIETGGEYYDSVRFSPDGK